MLAPTDICVGDAHAADWRGFKCGNKSRVAWAGIWQSTQVGCGMWDAGCDIMMMIMADQGWV
eukprot:1780944-Rhodomonas_salina.6